MFEELKGKNLSAITGLELGSKEILFETYEGDRYRMYHEQSCCESVSIQEIVGDPEDLMDVPLLEVYESSSKGSTQSAPHGWTPDEFSESYTWTFYRLFTMKGTVTIRWLGESNGYYSESVDFEELPGVDPIVPPPLPTGRPVEPAKQAMFEFLRSLRAKASGGE